MPATPNVAPNITIATPNFEGCATSDNYTLTTCCQSNSRVPAVINGTFGCPFVSQRSFISCAGTYEESVTACSDYPNVTFWKGKAIGEDSTSTSGASLTLLILGGEMIKVGMVWKGIFVASLMSVTLGIVL